MSCKMEIIYLHKPLLIQNQTESVEAACTLFARPSNRPMARQPVASCSRTKVAPHDLCWRRWCPPSPSSQRYSECHRLLARRSPARSTANCRRRRCTRSRIRIAPEAWRSAGMNQVKLSFAVTKAARHSGHCVQARVPGQ
jgi:hypothetical protein